MKSIIRNIAVVVVVSVTLSGCKGMLNQGSSTNSGLLGNTALSKPIKLSDIDTGKKQFRDANYGLAEKNFRRSVETDPSNAEAWLGLAASYDQLGLFNRSDRAYEQAIKLVGPKPAILNNQGYSQMLRGNNREARKLLKKAARMAPDNARIKGNLELLDKA